MVTSPSKGISSTTTPAAGDTTTTTTTAPNSVAGGGRSPSMRAAYQTACADAACKCNSELLRTLPDTAEEAASLKQIDLSMNFVGPVGFRALLSTLHLCPGLEVLRAPNNQLDNACALALYAALRYHPSVAVLDLSHNPISHEGGKHILLLCLATRTRVHTVELEDTLLNPALQRRIVEQAATKRTTTIAEAPKKAPPSPPPPQRQQQQQHPQRQCASAETERSPADGDADVGSSATTSEDGPRDEASVDVEVPQSSPQVAVSSEEEEAATSRSEHTPSSSERPSPRNPLQALALFEELMEDEAAAKGLPVEQFPLYVVLQVGQMREAGILPPPRRRKTKKRKGPTALDLPPPPPPPKRVNRKDDSIERGEDDADMLE